MQDPVLWKALDARVINPVRNSRHRDLTSYQPYEISHPVAQPYSVSIDSPHRFRLQIFQTLQNNRMEEAFGSQRLKNINSNR